MQGERQWRVVRLHELNVPARTTEAEALHQIADRTCDHRLVAHERQHRVLGPTAERQSGRARRAQVPPDDVRQRHGIPGAHDVRMPERPQRAVDQ